MKHLTVSIYGHDLASFVAITGSTETVYRRLVSNLETLLALHNEKPLPIEIAIRAMRRCWRRAISRGF